MEATTTVRTSRISVDATWEASNGVIWDCVAVLRVRQGSRAEMKASAIELLQSATDAVKVTVNRLTVMGSAESNVIVSRSAA